MAGAVFISPAIGRVNCELPDEIWLLLRETSRTVFGYNTFRPGQSEVIGANYNNTDYLAILPTAGGKTLTMILPQIARQRGLTVILSPTVSLIYDISRRFTEKMVSIIIKLYYC